MTKVIYKLSKSVVPMVLLCCSAGWCYAWSLFSGPIAEHMQASKTTVLLTFCLNILLLGLGAASFGSLVERKLKCSAMLSTVLMSVGFILTSYGIHMKSMLLVYTGSGICCGLAQGIAYVISPKNLLLWWSKTRYRATVMSLSIICFGLGSSLCALIFNHIFPTYGIEKTFAVLGAVYGTMMLIGTALVNKPKYALAKIKKSKSTFSVRSAMSGSMFWKLWTFMFLNISAGLVLIGNCVTVLRDANLAAATVIAVMFACGLSNGLGRLVFPFITDFMKNKIKICLVILGIELFLVILTAASPAPAACVTVPLMMILINATYGAAFSCLPSMILEQYGSKSLTALHGFILSSWGIASVFAYFCASMLSYFKVESLGMLLCILVVYAANFLNAMTMKNDHRCTNMI